MIKIPTRPINTRPARFSTELSRMSSMRAALNSQYCMRAQLLAHSLINGQASGQTNEEFFSYQEGQHRMISHKHKQKGNGNGKLHLPEEVMITKTANGKRWSTSAMEVELAKDILEVRDGWGKIVDAVVLNSSNLES